MKAPNHEYLQMKFFQTRRMPEVPRILILGSLEILPTTQAVSCGPLMAISHTKVGRDHCSDVSAAVISDQYMLTAHNAHRILFVWLGKCFINVINPFSKSKQKIRKSPQSPSFEAGPPTALCRYKAPVKIFVSSCNKMCTGI